MVANPQLIGESQAHLDLLDRISALAALDQPTLMTGERGTGKELFAARLHFLSPRWEGPYVKLNAASLPEDQLDARLFGVENDGIRSSGRIGVVESANGGTLFLDEVTELSARLQEKLLRVVEYGEFERVYGDETIQTNVRIVAATSETQATAQPKLRADLLDRMAFGVIHIPPLRERRDDILPLVLHFGKSIAVDVGLSHFPGFSAEAVEALLAHNWPGNVRELRTVVGRSVGLTTIAREQMGADPLTPFGEVLFTTLATPDWSELPDGPNIEPAASFIDPLSQGAAVANDQAEGSSNIDFSDRVMVFEKRLVEEALAANEHHQGRAADYLGLSYHQFRGLLKKHGVKR